jgi:ribosomal protein S18 acetylase RimI-like enzyme
MARLSNFLRRHDGSGRNGRDDGDADPLICRPAQRHEIDHSLRLLLAGPGGLAGEEQVLDFLSFAIQRGVDVNGVWVATRAGRLEWTLLPVVSPGRTMLVLTPTRLLKFTPATSAAKLIREVCDHFAQRDVHLAQLLLDPQEPAVRDVYTSAGFSVLAELVYLSRTVRRSIEIPCVPDGFQLLPYTPATHELFMRTITFSYRESLDCPALNGLRDMEDVLTGHKAAGEFEPSLWHVLIENDQPRAVLLLNRSPNVESLELVYLGLVPEARGRGLGDWMMKLALGCCARDEKTEISLAVDSRNAPALKLYFRHGLQRVGSRLAMLRDLRARASETATLA